MNKNQQNDIKEWANKSHVMDSVESHFPHLSEVLYNYILKNAKKAGYREEFGDKLEVFNVILPDKYKLRIDYMKSSPESKTYDLLASYDVFTPKGEKVNLNQKSNDSGIKKRKKCCRRRRSGSRKRRSGSKKRRSGSKKRRSGSKERY